MSLLLPFHWQQERVGFGVDWLFVKHCTQALVAARAGGGVLMPLKSQTACCRARAEPMPVCVMLQAADVARYN